MASSEICFPSRYFSNSPLNDFKIFLNVVSDTLFSPMIFAPGPIFKYNLACLSIESGLLIFVLIVLIWISLNPAACRISLMCRITQRHWSGISRDFRFWKVQL